MSLYDEIRSEKTLRSGRKPKIQEALQQLSKKDGQELLKAINDPTIPAIAITRVLVKHGIKLPAGAITRYRRGEATHEFV